MSAPLDSSAAMADPRVTMKRIPIPADILPQAEQDTSFAVLDKSVAGHSFLMGAAIMGRVDRRKFYWEMMSRNSFILPCRNKGQCWPVQGVCVTNLPPSNFLSVLIAPGSPRLSSYVSCSPPCLHGPSLHLLPFALVLPRLGSPAGHKGVPSPSSAELQRIPAQ